MCLNHTIDPIDTVMEDVVRLSYKVVVEVTVIVVEEIRGVVVMVVEAAVVTPMLMNVFVNLF